MKAIKISFLAVLALAFGLVSCGEVSQDSTDALAGSSLAANSVADLQTARGAKMVADIERFNLEAIKENFDMETLEILKIAQADKASEDQAIMSSIYQTMLSASSTKAQLQLNFSMSDEPVEDGIFIFSIETQEESNLVMEMYDNEGFKLANNTVNLTSGNNYRAVNVRDLNSGDYMFRLKNTEGAELVRSITIK